MFLSRPKKSETPKIFETIELHVQSYCTYKPTKQFFVKLPKSIRFGRFGLESPFQLRMWPVFEVNHRCPGPLQGCHVKALELDENNANAWRNLGVEGGGTVKGQAYDKKDRPWGGEGLGPVRVCCFRS